MNEEQMKHIANLISQDIEKDKEIERLNNIIKEVRKYIVNYFISGDEIFRTEILEILDKENKE